MSSYPPGGDYDERLLDSAPKATKAEKQEGYNVNLLASDTSETPINTRAGAATADGHNSLEAAVPTTKESYDSSYSVPWYRQKKWRIIMLIVAIIAIGAIVGGAVGGTLASKNNTSKPPSSSSGPVTRTITSMEGSSTGALAESTTTPPNLPTGSISPPVSGLGSSTDVGAGISTRTVFAVDPTPTPSVLNNGNFEGVDDPGLGVAPIMARSK